MYACYVMYNNGVCEIHTETTEGFTEHEKKDEAEDAEEAEEAEEAEDVEDVEKAEKAEKAPKPNEGLQKTLENASKDAGNILVNLIGKLKHVSGYLSDSKVWSDRIEMFQMDPMDLARRELKKPKE